MAATVSLPSIHEMFPGLFSNVLIRSLQLTFPVEHLLKISPENRFGMSGATSNTLVGTAFL